MATYTLPLTLSPNKTTLSYLTNNRRFPSQFTAAIQTAERAGDRWVLELDYDPLKGDKRHEVIAFYNRLQGWVHRFECHDHSHEQRGALGGTPVVDGASQGGFSLNVRGGPISTTGWLKANDYFRFGNELKRCTTDVDTDGTGDAAINFIPAIRTSPADGASITIDMPVRGVFFLTDPENPHTNKPFRGDTALSTLMLRAEEDVLA